MFQHIHKRRRHRDHTTLTKAGGLLLGSTGDRRVNGVSVVADASAAAALGGQHDRIGRPNTMASDAAWIRCLPAFRKMYRSAAVRGAEWCAKCDGIVPDWSISMTAHRLVEVGPDLAASKPNLAATPAEASGRNEPQNWSSSVDVARHVVEVGPRWPNSDEVRPDFYTIRTDFGRI